MERPERDKRVNPVIGFLLFPGLVVLIGFVLWWTGVADVVDL